MTTPDRQPLEGMVHTPDFDRWAAGMVESTTEYDWAELPPYLRDQLRRWCVEFSRWTRRVAEADALRKQVRG